MSDDVALHVYSCTCLHPYLVSSVVFVFLQYIKKHRSKKMSLKEALKLVDLENQS